MTIRRRLVISVTALFTVGLIVTGGASVFILNSQLVGEIDTLLIESSTFIAYRNMDFPRPERPPGVPVPAISGMAVVVVDSSGTTLFSAPSGRADEPDPLPDVSQLSATPSGSDPQVSEIGSVEQGGPTYRAVATSIQGGEFMVVLAVPLDNVEATIQRTRVILGAVGALTVVALGGLVLWVIRTGLRPIDDMIDAAGHIGEGDLSHRIPTAAPETEVGQLAVALNSMLAQIEAASDAKTESEAKMRQFLSDTSHELRTPLTSIRGYAELRRHGATSPEQIDRALDRIESEAVRMGGLVDDLLLLARLDQQPSMATEPVDITAVVDKAVRDAKAAHPERPIALNVGAAPILVVGDEFRLRQAVDNVLANACHHTAPATPVTVTVSADDTIATVAISDGGPGMTEEEAARAFERFYQADRNRSGAGSGLGLPIVEAIVASHGGTVALDTAPEQGTTVTIHIPVGAEPVPPTTRST